MIYLTKTVSNSTSANTHFRGAIQKNNEWRNRESTKNCIQLSSEVAFTEKISALILKSAGKDTGTLRRNRNKNRLAGQSCYARGRRKTRSRATERQSRMVSCSVLPSHDRLLTVVQLSETVRDGDGSRGLQGKRGIWRETSRRRQKR